MKGERDGDVGAGPDGEVHISGSRELRAARVDHDQLRATLLRFPHEGYQMNA